MKAPTTVIVYHAIDRCPRHQDPHNLFVPPEVFGAHMSLLARDRTVVPLEAILSEDVETDKPAVAITFDDGYRSVVENAGPILERCGFGATVFVPTRWIGMSNAWVESSSCDLDIMSEEELAKGARLGIGIESHGHRHIDFGQASLAEATADIETSIQRLTELSGIKPRFFAYPYGRHSKIAREAVKRAGLDAAFTIDSKGEGRYALERVQITPLDGLALFGFKTSGRYSRIRHSRLAKAGYPLLRPVLRRFLRR
jgi:peptidoglycan/xylan/chitin deacetylase (PgdA/CDA1 family)